MRAFAQDALRTITSVKVFDNGVLRQIRQIRVQDNGTLRTVFTWTPPNVTVTSSRPTASARGNSSTLTTQQITAIASGGTPPYSYVWTITAYDSASPPVISDTNFASTYFTLSGMSPGDTNTGTARCTVTDTLGAVGTVDVPLFFNYFTGTFGGPLP